MSKIKVTLPGGEIATDGKHVSFRAPCNCTGVTAIVIDDVEYSLVDAIGTSISEVTKAFTKGSLVAVVLDTINSKAFIQNQAQAATHEHTASNITKMTGYAKASSAGAITADDSLLTAIGKLEKKLEVHTHSLSSAFIVMRWPVSAPGLASHTYMPGDTYEITNVPDGYKPIGIIGWSTNTYKIRPTSHYITSDGKLFTGFANTASTDSTADFIIEFRILCIKDSI